MLSLSSFCDTPSPGSSDDDLINLNDPNGVTSPSTPRAGRWHRIQTRWRHIKIFLSSTPCGTAIMVCICVLQLLLGLAVTLGPGAYTVFIHKPGIVIDKSIQAFNIPSHEAMKRHDALDLAINDARSSLGRRKRDIHRSQSVVSSEWTRAEGHKNLNLLNQNSVFYNSLRKEYQTKERSDVKNSFLTLKRQKRAYNLNYRESQQKYIIWRLQLVFLAEGKDDNIFTKERLNKIHQVEKLVTQHPQYKNFCYKGRQDPVVKASGGCTPINSLLTYFYPSQQGNVVYYNGLGDTLEDINKTLLFAMNDERFYWYVDDHIDSKNLKSRLLRSEVQFGGPLKSKLHFYILFLFMFENFVVLPLIHGDIIICNCYHL